jgi:type IV pilus assembly protein PilV
MNPLNKPTHRLKSHQSGVSLVEALVALVVISIGMLGIAALHVESLRNGKASILRTQAVALAANIADSIRANPVSATTYTSAITAADKNSACEPGGAGCTASEMATNDVAVWLDQLAKSLPSGTGSITSVTTTTPATYTITVQWVETTSLNGTAAGAATGATQSYALRIQV